VSNGGLVDGIALTTNSQNMAPKQAEMDGIVQKLYKAVETIPELKSTLIVLAGDHGMNDAGNHGGSGAGETSPALVLLSPKFKQISGGIKCPAEFREDFDYYTKVEQSDIVPTLAGLVGTAIPRNNLGVFIKSFLGLWDEASQKKLMEGNAKQLYEIADARYSDFDKRGPFNVDCNSHDSEADTLACLWKETKEGFESSDISPEEAVKRAYKVNHPFYCYSTVLIPCLQFSEKCQDYLSSTATNYNLTLMGLGTALIFVAFFASAVYLAPMLNESHVASASFVFITILYGITMFASSFVEEEHHFWYWTASAWAVVLLIKEYSIPVSTRLF
jgi:ethanolamine phosphate transferase 2 subunit G